MPSSNRVVTLANAGSPGLRGHEAAAREAMARKLADLLGYEFAGEHEPAKMRAGHVYFVPQDTLLREPALRLGIRDAADLYGGVVPNAFVATKAITHPAPAGARVPARWPHELAARLHNIVLQGFSVFDADDARRAARSLLPCGRVRIKPAQLLGGAGQRVVATESELDTAIAALDVRELHEHGVVVEQNVESARTYSIGEVRAAGLHIAYYGTQHAVVNHHGHEVYGGSDLLVVRGRLANLLDLDLAPTLNLAVWQTLAYDRAIAIAFPQFFASRRNYDVLQGSDEDGRLVSGVLEQSWRFGGASPAEIAALAALKGDRLLRCVRASTREIYAPQPLPANADVYFDGVDANAGRLVKYSVVEPAAGDARGAGLES